MKDKILISILIVLISVIHGLPNILLFLSLGNSFTPLTTNGRSPLARDETYAYAPLVKYVLDGNFPLRDVYVYEYANSPTPFLGETVPATVLAFLAKISGSIERAFIISDFIFPPIIFLIFYLTSRLVIKNNYFSLATAFVTTLSRDFISTIPYPHETLQLLNFSESQNFLIYLSRAFHPQITLLIFSAIFFSILKLKSNGPKKMVIIIGVLIGILFYSYVFYWTYMVTFLTLYFIYQVASKNYLMTKRTLILGFIGFVAGIPYFINILNFNKLPISRDFFEKTSLSGVPIPLTVLRYLAITCVFYFLTRKMPKQFRVYSLFLLAGLIISPLSKIVLGQDLETFHYLRRALMPYATIAFFVIVFLAVKRFRRVTVLASFGLIIIFSLVSIRSQIIASSVIQKAHIKNQEELLVLNWLRANTQKSSVVGSLDTDFNLLIPVYTSNKTYFPPTDRTVMPTNEGVERYIILSSILGVNKELQKEKLDGILSYLFIYQTYQGINGVDFNSPKRLEADGRIYNYQFDLAKIGKYKIDYLVVTPNQLVYVSPSLKSLKLETTIGEYIIFKVNE